MKKMKRLLSLILCLALIAGILPAVYAAEEPTPLALPEQIDGRAADPATLNDWMAYFGPETKTTEYAGGVWTDKSVFTSVPGQFPTVTMMDADTNFLVALSAIGSNKEVVGYATTPTDTMFVLDVSGSMDDSNSVTDMVRATNAAIDRLLELNYNNRVGVVLYSGNAQIGASDTRTGTVILPLDRYTTTSAEQYAGEPLDQYLIGTDRSNEVSVASGTRNSGGQRPTGRKSVVGGTYIQNGLFQAWKQFEAVTDTVIPAGNVQEGAKRMPIVVLMGDGAPTTGTVSFDNVGTSDTGSGQIDPCANKEMAFLTQLTAAWIRSKMEQKYDIAPRFYTLGLGTASSNIATAVLDPMANTVTSSYWGTYKDLPAGGTMTMALYDTKPVTEIIGRYQKDVLHTHEATVTKSAVPMDRDYVDEYWYANNAASLITAFNNIVDEIIIQSRYYSTLVTSGNHALDGYITFEDHLGAFMEVKDVKGILIADDRLCTGAGFAQAAVDGDFGTDLNATGLGKELIHALADRFGVDAATAWSLLGNALADGQIAWSDAGHSNYIGWYADESGLYIAPWRSTDATAPAGAVYLNKSYIYLGTERTSHTYSDMMYAMVRVRTRLETGDQEVGFAIPASLVPMVTYKITTSSDQLTADSLTSLRSDAADKSPMRLVFEAGLVDEIDPVDLATIMADADHSHPTGDGGYWFYSNRWAVEDYDDPTTHQAATSHFHPSLQNERYYYTADAAIYTDASGSAMLTAAPEAGKTYFRKLTYVDNSNGLTLTDKYVPISSASMIQENLTVIDGVYHIKAGTVYQEVGRFITDKVENVTGTLAYSDYPLVYHPDDADDAAYYDVYALLGNNGCFTMYPAQGVALTKSVTETVTGAADAFTFDIALDTAIDPDALRFTDASGNALEVSGAYADGAITVTLAAGQTVYITGLPTGVGYTITERADPNYKMMAATGTTGTVAQFTVNEATVVNGPKRTGDLVLTKDVDHPFATAPAQSFQFTVDLDGTDVTGKTFTTSTGSVTTDENGTFTVTLADDETITVYGIPEDTVYTVTELAADGYPLDAAASTGMTGTIPGNGTAYAHAINRYTTTSASMELTVTGTKTLTGRDWMEGDSFTFQIQQWNGTTFVDVAGLTDTVTHADTAKTYTIDMSTIVYDTPGTYYYQVIEVAGDNPGIRYATNTGMFYVTVADADQDGQLEANVTVSAGANISQNDQDVYIVTTNFTNSYATKSLPVTLRIQKEIRDENGALVTDVPLSGFMFQIGDAYVVTNELGQASVELELPSNGDRATLYYFPIRELAPTREERIPGMSYDTQFRELRIDVKDNGRGQLTATVYYPDGTSEFIDKPLDTTITVVNTYDLEPVQITFQGSKELVGRELKENEQFTFTLTPTDGTFTNAAGDALTATVGEGAFSFETLSFTEVGTYYYLIEEQAPDTVPGGMTYDPAQYRATIRVTMKADGTLTTATTVTKVGVGTVADTTASTVSGLGFVNTYAVNDTETVELGGDKTLTGRDMAEGEFTFVLALPDGTVVDTATNRADKTFAFDALIYTQPGVWNYVITEAKGASGGVQYDDASYPVTVTITDNGDGTLSKTVTGADAIVFNNAYATNTASLTLDGTKILLGGGLTEGQFSFLLHKTDADFEISLGSRASIVSNGADGGFSFDLSYDTPGTRYYALVEDTSDPQADILYDAALYRIRVDVVDDGEGHLTASYTWAATGVTSEDIEFVNVPYEKIARKDVFLASEPEISIDGQRVKVGQELVYTIAYTNYNRAPVDVTISDKIPACTTYVDGSGGSYADGYVTWNFEAVSVGETVTVSFRVVVADPDVELINQATVMDGVNTYRTNETINHTWDDIPKTDDPAPLGLVMALALMAFTGLIVLIMAGKKQKN